MSLCCRPVGRNPVKVGLAVVCVLALLGVACLARGDGPKPDLAALIRQLGADDFEQREQASRRLSDLGEDALDALKAATKSADAEVRRRASELVALIERKLYGELAVLVGHTDGLWTAAFSPDGKKAATCSDDKSLRLWDADTGRELRRFELASAVNVARFFADGKRLLVGLSNGELLILDADSGKVLVPVGKHTDEVVGLEFLPGEAEAISCSRDRTLKRWALNVPKLVRTWEGHTEMIRNVALDPAGRLAATASFDGTVRVWDLAAEGDPVQVLRPEGGMAFGVRFSPDGRQLATGTADRLVRVWDVATGEEVSRFEGHAGFVYSTAFLPDGRRLMSASEDGSVRVWSLRTGAELRAYRGHTDYARYVELSPDGRRFLSASKDHTARLWAVPRE